MGILKSAKNKTCPQCAGTGKNLQTGQGTCTNCKGAGQTSPYFDFSYYYPWNLYVTAPGLPSGFVAPNAPNQPPVGNSGQLSYGAQNAPGVAYPGNPTQTGNNPAILKLGNESPMEWIFSLIKCRSPYMVGDASDWLMVLLEDVSGVSWPFMNSPILASLFAGDARNPFPQLNPLTFGPGTQLKLTGFPILIGGNTVALGVGTGAAATFSGVLNGPVTPGSVVVTSTPAAGPPATVTGSDSTGNGVISNAGGTISGTVNYTTGAISVTFTVDPAAGNVILVTYTQGPAVITAQFAIQGNAGKLIGTLPTPQS